METVRMNVDYLVTTENLHIYLQIEQAGSTIIPKTAKKNCAVTYYYRDIVI